MNDVLLAKICFYEHVKKLCFMSIHDMHNHIVCLSEDRVACCFGAFRPFSV